MQLQFNYNTQKPITIQLQQLKCNYNFYYNTQNTITIQLQ